MHNVSHHYGGETFSENKLTKIKIMSKIKLKCKIYNALNSYVSDVYFYFCARLIKTLPNNPCIGFSQNKCLIKTLPNTPCIGFSQNKCLINKRLRSKSKTILWDTFAGTTAIW